MCTVFGTYIPHESAALLASTSDHVENCLNDILTESKFLQFLLVVR